MHPMTAYVALALAIVSELAGTTLLQKTEQFTKPLPTVLMALSYTASLYCLSRALERLPLGIAYAIWGGLGIVLSAVIGVVVYKQSLDLPAYLAIGLIVAGVLVFQIFSRSFSH
jgi:small multidrug resistance pump